MVNTYKSMTLPHVMLLVFDDLRPWFKPFSDSGIAAPNLAALAASSMTFHNTYVQQAVCGPSRNSFMSGRRPSSTRTWNFKTSFRQSGIDTKGVPGSEWRTLPQSFKEAGYLTLGMGKLFHPNSPYANDCPDPHPDDGAPDCPSWTTSFVTSAPANVTLDGKPVLRCGGGDNASCDFDYVNPDAQIFTQRPVTLSNGTVVEASPACADLADAKCTDEWLAEAATATLRAAAAASRPFFFAAGFHKPHPFWQLPQRFQDQYADLPLPRAEARKAPAGMPDVAYYSCDALNGRTDFGGPFCDDAGGNPVGNGTCRYIVPDGGLPDHLVRHVRAGYAGGITWTDLQVGKVLGELDSLGLADKTVVAAWADHGWTLGEHAMFCKMANLELHTRVPLMLRVPWLSHGAARGANSTAMVELVDVYPTLAELAGIDTVRNEALEGTSLVPLLTGAALVEAGSGIHLDDERHGGGLSAAFSAAFSQYPRCLNTSMSKEPPFLGTRDPCVGVPANEFTHMGYSVRVAAWRFTEWPRWKASLEPDWSAVEGVELYAHAGDDGTCLDCFENANVADDPKHAAVVKRLRALLRAAPAIDRPLAGRAYAESPDVAWSRRSRL